MISNGRFKFGRAQRISPRTTMIADEGCCRAPAPCCRPIFKVQTWGWCSTMVAPLWWELGKNVVLCTTGSGMSRLARLGFNSRPIKLWSKKEATAGLNQSKKIVSQELPQVCDARLMTQGQVGPELLHFMSVFPPPALGRVAGPRPGLFAGGSALNCVQRLLAMCAAVTGRTGDCTLWLSVSCCGGGRRYLRGY
jgi:hypothetical protein